MLPTDTTSPAVLERLQRRSADPKRRILFTGATIVTMDPGLGVLHGADLLVEGEIIAAIGSDLNRDGAVVVEASGTVLTPGFVDTHRHAWETQLRRIMPDVDDLGAYVMSTLMRLRHRLPARRHVRRHQAGRPDGDRQRHHVHARFLPQLPYSRAFRRRRPGPHRHAAFAACTPPWARTSVTGTSSGPATWPASRRSTSPATTSC